MKRHIHTPVVRALIVSAAVKRIFYGAVGRTMRQGNHTRSLNLHSTELLTQDCKHQVALGVAQNTV